MFPAQVETYRWYCDVFTPLAQNLLNEGNIRSHPISVRESRLNGVLEGLKELKEERLSGGKLIYRIEDTK